MWKQQTKIYSKSYAPIQLFKQCVFVCVHLSRKAGSGTEEKHLRGGFFMHFEEESWNVLEEGKIPIALLKWQERDEMSRILLKLNFWNQNIMLRKKVGNSK